MSQAYNQRRALWAITKASFRAIFRNPSALVFSIIFPIIFIMIFGSFGNGGPSRSKITFAEGTDTTSELYKSIVASDQIRVLDYKNDKGVTDTTAIRKDLEDGDLVAVVEIKDGQRDSSAKKYVVQLHSTSASGGNIWALKQTVDNISVQLEKKITGVKFDHFTIVPDIKEVRKYKTIDFVLPGQLGFSILFSTLFGIAFTFYNLRETLVLKRFYASPVNRINILLGIGMSRLFFQLVSVTVLILVGHFALGFTLQNGIITFIEMLLLTIYMLFILMGVGLIFSSIVKSDTSIPLFINLFGFPQMLLSGTFFSIEVFPKWMQPICRALPLTQFNDAMRKISFQGIHLTGCWKEIGILGIWAAVIYAIVIRVFKWE